MKGKLKSRLDSSPGRVWGHLWISALLLVLVSELMHCGTRGEYPVASPCVWARMVSFVILHSTRGLLPSYYVL